MNKSQPTDFSISFEERMKVMMASGRFGRQNARKEIYKLNTELFHAWQNGTADINLGDHKAFLDGAKLYRTPFDVSDTGRVYELTCTGCINADCMDVAQQLIAQGYVSGRPTMGIRGERVSLFYQRYYLMPPGLFITHLDPDSDAAKKGIQTDDILMSINDVYITSMDDLNNVLYTCEVGDTVDVIIYRAGKQYLIKLTLSEAKG
jgi:hypothetical protein